MKNESISSEHSVKVLLVGNSSVGKTSIMLRYLDNFFVENFLPTVGIDFKTKLVGHNGKNIKVNLWDTAGQEKFRTLTTSYYKGANAVLFVFDITERDSFFQLKEWMMETKKHVGNDFVGIIVGNKLDLDFKRVVKTDELLYLAEDVQMPAFEVSAKSGANINELFETLVDLVMTEQMKEPHLSSAINLEDKSRKSKNKTPLKKKFKKCC